MDQLSIHIPGEPRQFAAITHLPPLARFQVRHPDVKPRGVRRLAAKGIRIAYRLYHNIFGQPAPAALELVCRDRSTVGIAVDGGKAIYIDFASRQRHGGYEPEGTLLIDALLPGAATFYDVGANWGYFTWLAATTLRFKGTVYCFETAPALVAELERVRNGARFAHVEIMPFGLSDRDENVPVPKGQSGLQGADSGISRRNGKPAVRRLDDLGLPPPDLVRIDGSHHARAALEGGSATVRAHRPAILFECREAGCEDMHILFDLLRDNEYLFHVVHRTETGIALSPANVSDPDAIPAPCALLAAPHRRLASLLADRHVADPQAATGV